MRLQIHGEPVALPPGLDLSAYRIVQEGLTNALKHARASQAEVDVHYGAAELRLEVRDDGRGGPSTDGGLGHGLVGIGERVKIYGGDMSAGAARAGGFVLRARLPLDGGAAMTIRVLVVDDQSMVRAGFRLLLADEPDIEVVAEASNGLEAVAQAARFHPDVILMDIRMPELDGLEATRRILAADPSARILILTTFDLDDYVYEALRAGASGFVLKDDPPEQLIAAVRTVAGGEALLSPADHPARDPALHPPAPAGSAAGGGDPDRPGDGRVPPDHRGASPTPRSGRSSSSATRRSRRTSPACCRSSTCATARRRSCSPTRPASSTTSATRRGPPDGSR